MRSLGKVLTIMLFVPLLALLSGSISYAADCCGVSDVNILIIAPNGQTRLYTNCTYVSTTGTCSSSSATTVTYSCNIGYTFCPVEGTYNATVYVAADSDCTTCGNYTVRTQTISNFYTVNYDVSSGWCQCKMGSGYWALGGEVAASSCCGDDAGEYRRQCAGDLTVCSASSDDIACCDSPTDCVFNNTCYPSGTGFISLNGGTFVCSNGTWTNCLPPPSVDWNIISTCTVSSALNVVANIWVKAGGLLHVLSGGSISVGGGYIFVLPGGEIQIEPGGQIS